MSVGLRVGAARALPTLSMLSLLLAACTADKPAGDLGFSISFACEGDKEASDQLVLSVVPGGCSASNQPVYTATLQRGESAPVAKNVNPGLYGVGAVALREGAAIATGCYETRLPSDAAFEVTLLNLENPGCGVGPEADGETPDGEVDPDAGMMDGAVDAETKPDAELELVDAQSDADATIFIPCATSCDDNNPCTDNVCDTTTGTCTNPPLSFTGLECDKTGCTVGDFCDNGVCKSGPAQPCPNDDNNTCTSETCVVGQGCVRANVANNTRCNDGISCTGTGTDATDDRCTGGRCSGTDLCVARSEGNCVTINSPTGVCSDVGCTSTNAATKCNDNNPCTNDDCVASKCVHSANDAASCSDGKSCTDDRCSNQACVSTSACGQGAQCLVPTGGTPAQAACTCTVAGQSFCGNNCFNLNTDVNNCGDCGRSCGANYTCENGACKPTSADRCVAHRNTATDRDYLVCSDASSWTDARQKCANWRMGLTIIDDAAENDFLRTRIASTARWTAGNDRGPDTNECETLTDSEGHWWWSTVSFPNAAPNNSNPSFNERAVNFCNFASNNANSCSAANGRYQNWGSGQPDNANCVCDETQYFVFCISKSEGEDCATIRSDGSWNDETCSKALGYICETP